MSNAAKRLDGRIALVTGATRGIGRAIALRYAQEGAHVIALARNSDQLEVLDDEIEAVGGTATLVPMDLKDWAAIDGLAAPLAQRWGKLDILVGNAGLLGTIAPMPHFQPDMWEDVFKVNVHANWRLIRALDPLLRAADAGRVLFVTSGVTRRAAPHWGVYAASKAALESMAVNYAAEVQQSNVRVNMINPGATRTEMRKAAFPGEDAEQLTTAEEIATAFVDPVTPGFDGNGLWIAADEWLAARKTMN